MLVIVKVCLLIFGLNLPQKCQGQVDPTRPIVKMDEYEQEYRLLDCWQCFEAHGKMCFDRSVTMQNFFSKYQTANTGLGVCCKPDSTDVECDASSPDTNRYCGERAFDDRSDSPNKQILTEGKRNHQAFAFCPMTSRQICGIGEGSDGLDMSLMAAEEHRAVLSTEIKYIEGNSEVRQYDACYYEISIDNSLS